MTYIYTKNIQIIWLILEKIHNKYTSQVQLPYPLETESVVIEQWYRALSIFKNCNVFTKWESYKNTWVMFGNGIVSWEGKDGREVNVCLPDCVCRKRKITPLLCQSSRHFLYDLGKGVDPWYQPRSLVRGSTSWRRGH